MKFFETIIVTFLCLIKNVFGKEDVKKSDFWWNARAPAVNPVDPLSPEGALYGNSWSRSEQRSYKNASI